MHPSRHLLALLTLCTALVLADHLLPTYPTPIDLTSDESLVSASWKNLSSTFDGYLTENKDPISKSLFGVENVTFSVGLFSLHDPAATRLQYHYTAPEIANSKRGTNKVDEDTIYRIASVSKLITTFAGQLTLAKEDWDRPLSDIIPQLGDYARANADNLNPVYTIQWDQITPWSLATQLSGIPTVGYPGADLLVAYLRGVQADPASGPATLASYGLPLLEASALESLGSCASRTVRNMSDTFCSAPAGVKAVAGMPPNFLPWTTPAYSDLNFMLLGIAISNITGKELTAVYQDSVFDPLGMDSSYDTHPTGEAELARSVISGDFTTNFGAETGFTAPSGGLLSTLKDLSKFGIGILNNTLLSADRTRKWMKPQTHTASMSDSIGAGWEIHRFVHPTSGRLTDMYTKLGDSGNYGAALCIIPQYDAGFTLLSAGNATSGRSSHTLVILDYVTNSILPALEAQAAEEAKINYVGTYVSTDESLNASVTIAFNKSSVPGIISGLSVTQWTFNGSDVLKGELFGGEKPRLQLSVPKQTPDGSLGQVAFQASLNPQISSYSAAMAIPDSGVIGPWTGFYATNFDFAFTDNRRYGGVEPNMFVFDVDADGKATACSPAVDRVTLKRKEDD